MPKRKPPAKTEAEIEAREQDWIARSKKKFRHWSIEEFEKLDRDDQLIEVARTNVELYGQVVPPPDYCFHIMKQTCVHCGKTGPLLQDFGIKVEGGVAKKQSWCKECRGSKDARPGLYSEATLKSLANRARELTPREQEELRELLEELRPKKRHG